MQTLRIIARDEARVGFVDETGRHHIGRWAGRGTDGAPRPEEVPDLAYYRRAVARGDLAFAPKLEPPSPAEANVPATES